MTIYGRTLAGKLAWRARSFLLPQPLRREAALAATGPLVIAGFFRTASGVGASARSCADALACAGLDPVCVDLSAIFDQTDMEADRALAAMPAAPGGVLILHANAPETARAIFMLGLRRPARWRIAGVWAWELAAAPQSWLKAARWLSELWVPSAFIAGAFAGRLPAPVRIASHYVIAQPDAAPDRARFGVADAGVVCIAMADGRSSFERKNLDAAIRIFREAARGRDDAALIVKTRNIAEFPAYAARLDAAADGDRRIVRIDASLPAAAQRALLASADIVLSPHRAEGFGLVLAEAMALGKAVVATGWSGNMDFMDAQSAALIPYTLRPVPADAPTYGAAGRGLVWAEPDEAAAAALLHRLFEEPQTRARLGAAAREKIADRLDGSAYVAALKGLGQAAPREDA